VDRDHELSAVLADETRYHIYRSIAEHAGSDVTVAEIAERFHLHPNVARMHLTKLEQGGFVATSFRRASGGGRPAKLYRLSDTVVNFGFPPRRYELLSRLALHALAAGGSRDDALRVCREAGVDEGRRELAREEGPPSTAAGAAEIVRQITEDQGLLPEVLWEGATLKVIVHNCAFGEVSGGEPDLVCPMHRAFLEGVLDVVTAGLGHLHIEAGSCCISRGGDRCEMLCSMPAGGEPAPGQGRGET
jgi:predicted ArsR family transcriptional regulator